MIPTTIRREHVLRAAEWIDQHGDGGRSSRRYLVIINGKPYPPKLVISKAYFYAHGSEWSHGNFHGGEETNSYLRRLGFEIQEIGSPYSDVFGSHDARSGKTPPVTPSAPVLDRVMKIARSMNTRVTTIESDAGNQNVNSLLLLHMAEGNDRGVHVFSEREGEDDVLYVFMPIEFDPPVSGYVCDAPEEEYSEFLTGLMRGRTRFKVGLEGRLLKSVDLRQVVPVPAGDDALKRVFLAAVVEILATEEAVRASIHDARASMRGSTGKRANDASRDSMYA